MRWLLAAILLILGQAAQASITHVNYLQSDPTQRYVSLYDVNGNALDVREGDLKQFSGVWYYYGESARCGYIAGTASPFCGFRVYSSPDLVNWTDQGTLFDPNSGSWQTLCGGQDGNYNGCWRPKMLFNASTGKFVLFFYEFTSSVNAIHVFDCTTAIGGCTYIAAMPGIAAGFTLDMAVYQDDVSSAAYLLYNTAAGSAREIFIQQLTSDYHDVTGSATDTGVSGEALALVHVGSHWHMVYGSTLCGNCPGGATTSYVTATSALGTYGGLTTLGPAGSCNSQMVTVTKIVASGTTTYLYLGDRFTGDANFGQSAPYWQPLTLTGDLFDTFSCTASVTIPGVTSTGTYPTPAYPGTFDVNLMSSLNADFFDDARIDASLWIMQTITPTTTGTYSIGVNLAKSTTGCTPGVTICSVPDGSLKVDLTTLDGSGNPATVLASKTYAASAVPWTTSFTNVFTTALTGGTSYAVVVKAIGTTHGKYVVSRAQPASAIYAHPAKYTPDAGSSWNALTNESMQASTFVSLVASVPFSGVAH